MQVVSAAEGVALAAEFDIPFLEVSAKSNQNVDLAFTTLATSIRNRLIADGLISRSGKSLGNAEAAKGDAVHLSAGEPSGRSRKCC